MLLSVPKGHQRAEKAATARTKINARQKAMLGGREARWLAGGRSRAGRGAGSELGAPEHGAGTARARAHLRPRVPLSPQTR